MADRSPVPARVLKEYEELARNPPTTMPKDDFERLARGLFGERFVMIGNQGSHFACLRHPWLRHAYFDRDGSRGGVMQFASENGRSIKRWQIDRLIDFVDFWLATRQYLNENQPLPPTMDLSMVKQVIDLAAQNRKKK